jgi:putative DNA primase/helicase
MAERKVDEMVFFRLQQLKEGKIQYSDSSNAFRLVREHGEDIRYNAAWKKWLVWTGKNWQIDEGYLIQDLALKVVQGIYDEVLNTHDYQERMDIEKHAVQCESMRRRKAMVEAATNIPVMNIAANDVDKNPWLFNVENGTIELGTGVFREHKREDMITKIASVSYDAAADCPLWKQFVRGTATRN